MAAWGAVGLGLGKGEGVGGAVRAHDDGARAREVEAHAAFERHEQHGHPRLMEAHHLTTDSGG